MSRRADRNLTEITDKMFYMQLFHVMSFKKLLDDCNIYIYIYIYIYIVLFGPVKPELGAIPSGQETLS